MRALRRLGLVLVMLALGGGALWLRAELRTLEAPLPLASAETLELASGTTLIGLLAQWQTRGWISPPAAYWLRLEARLQSPPPLRAGEYELLPGTTPREALALFRSGRVRLHQLRLVEGWTLRGAIAAVRAHPAIEPVLDEASLAPDKLLAALDLGEAHAEGRLRPETYAFPRGMTDAAFLRRAAEAQTEALQRAWSTRYPELPLADADAALTLASIVEKETGIPEERAEVAGVFINRLRLGMRLQTDPTVIYGLGPGFEGRLRRVHLTTDTPYNTYTRVGLPPTPICLPGTAALRAAVQPAETPALFFVARGDGSGAHVFSVTLDEHNRAVQAYLQRLRAQQARP
jgi:UPF0755 protein